MNEKMPYTPFSTRLSGSARETEIRLRNLFSGPKKRPPALFLALVFSLCLLCGNLVSCQMAAENAPPAEKWVDYWIIPWNIPWENSDETIELSEYPGVTFRWTPSTVSAEKDGETTELFSGMPIWNVFLCDFNGDGLREFWATVSYGSGMIDTHIVVYDYASGAQYTLWDRGTDDYMLSLEDGRLRVTRSEYNGPIISTGGLTLTEDGTLKMTDEVPVTDAPPAEDGSLNAADAAADAFYRPYGPASDKLPIDEPLKLWFGSGAGGWATILTLHPDGSFEGDFSDYDMTTVYVCQFHGRFRNIQQYSSAGWTMELEELVLDTGRPIGEEWNEDGYHYISSSPYGFSVRNDEDIDIPLEPGAPFNFYTPEASAKAPGSELYGMEDESSDLFDFWGWWPQRQNITGTDTPLGCYALYNLKSGYGFFDFHSWGIE